MKLHHYTEIKLHVCVIGLPPQLNLVSTRVSKHMSVQLEFEFGGDRSIDARYDIVACSMALILYRYILIPWAGAMQSDTDSE